MIKMIKLDNKEIWIKIETIKAMSEDKRHDGQAYTALDVGGTTYYIKKPTFKQILELI